jgi:hypothetical protein
VFYHFLGTVRIVPGPPVVQSAEVNMELVESTDVPIIDRKDASDGSGNSNSEVVLGYEYDSGVRHTVFLCDLP